MKKIVTAFLYAAPLFVLNANAEAPMENPDLGARFLLTGGITYGGDELAEIEYTNGDDTDIHAGGLVLLGIGGVYRYTENWEAQLSVNYHVDRADAKNGDATFDRFPIDLLGFYRAGAHRFGGGLTYHMNPKFEVDFDSSFSNGQIDFDDALGVVVEYDYFFSDSISLGVRYVNIKYEASDLADDIDGNYGGLIVNGYF